MCVNILFYFTEIKEYLFFLLTTIHWTFKDFATIIVECWSNLRIFSFNH